MADNEQKARQLVAEAEKKEKSSQGFLGSLFGYVTRIQPQYDMNHDHIFFQSNTIYINYEISCNTLIL